MSSPAEAQHPAAEETVSLDGPRDVLPHDERTKGEKRKWWGPTCVECNRPILSQSDVTDVFHGNGEVHKAHHGTCAVLAQDRFDWEFCDEDDD